MSEEVVQIVIGRAVTDPDFRELLFDNPDKALQGYDLTEAEVKSLRQIEREKFDAGLEEMEERISRAGFTLANYLSYQSPFRNISDGPLMHPGRGGVQIPPPPNIFTLGPPMCK